MIHLSAGGEWIRWDKEDEPVLMPIIGPDQVGKGYTAVIDSVVKKALSRGGQVQPALKRMVKAGKKERKHLRLIRSSEDRKKRPRRYPISRWKKAFPHQRIALWYMDDRPAYLLADQPGVGKTAVAILWASIRAKKRILVVTPGSARYQWAREIKRWSKLKPRTVVEGTIPEQAELLQRDGWVICHWEALAHCSEDVIKKHWDVVILDESHNIRNRKILRTKTAFNLAKKSDYRLALSGHPFISSPDELWTTLAFLYPEKYKSFWRFMGMHVEAVPCFHGGLTIVGSRQPKLLKWEIEPFTIRRTKKEVFPNLEEIARIGRHVNLDRRRRKEYEKLVEEIFVNLGDEEITLTNALTRTMRCRQYLVDPAILGSKLPSLKYPIVEELMAELDGPPVIFTSFRQAADRLASYLGRKKFNVRQITGKVKNKDREKHKRLFLKGKLDALIVVTQAGGTALNLGKYGYVIFLDLPWSGADLEQAEARVDRPEEDTGLLVPTTSFGIVTRNTYEDRLQQIILNKGRMFGEVFPTSALGSLFNWRKAA